MEKKRDSFFLPNKKNNAGKDKQKVFSNKRQEQFVKNRNVNNDQPKAVNEKKPFDKKAYRLKKYSKKYKLEQWEEQRKKKLLHEYNKEIKNEAVSGTYKPKKFDEDAPDGSIGRFVRHPDLIEIQSVNNNKPQPAKKDPFHKAKEHFNKVKEEKLEKQQLMEKAREEKRQRLEAYKKKKQDRFKKLSKKTKKGQPVMTGRLELLLEKIQKG